MPTKMAVCGKNSNGTPDIFFCLVNCTKDEYEDGLHYDLAEQEASNNGYEGPFVTFDEDDNKTIMSLFVWESITEEDILFIGLEFKYVEIGSSFTLKGKNEKVQMKICNHTGNHKIKYNTVDSDGVLGYISNSNTKVKVIKTIALTE